MKMIKKLLLNFFLWYFWKNLHIGLKSVLGHKTLSASIQEMRNIEIIIRLENNLKHEDVISWDNSTKTNRELYAKYVTLKHFNEVGTLLAFFRSVDKNKIMKE